MNCTRFMEEEVHNRPTAWNVLINSVMNLKPEPDCSIKLVFRLNNNLYNTYITIDKM